VIFSSDNGGYLTYGENFRNISSNGPLRDQKGSIYEGGHRVPAIVAWPGTIPPAATDATAHSTDLLPTLARLAGASTEGLSLDGLDLTPLLLDGAALPDRTLFWRSGEKHAVRHGPWKLCVTGGRTELYNLADDLGERHDLAARHPERVQELLRAWQAWEADVNRSAQEADQ
jgi:arylsulfatase A-like enzyme